MTWNVRRGTRLQSVDAVKENSSEVVTTQALGLWLGRGIVVLHVVLLVATMIVLSHLPADSIAHAIGWGVLLGHISILLIWLILVKYQTNPRSHEGVVYLVMIAVVSIAGCAIAALALPIMVARGEGMRVERFRPGSLPVPRPFQFSVSQLLKATVLVAIVFALGQFASHGDAPHTDFGPVLAMISLIVFWGVCLVAGSTIPVVCVWVVLSPGTVLPRLGMAAVAWLLAGVLVVHHNGDTLPNVPYLMSATGVAMLLLFATLFVLRSAGYRMIWRG